MNDKKLDVYYKDKLVGTLAETATKLIAFQYSDEWINNGFSISPFSLPLSSEVYIPKDTARERFKGLFGVFADSLPDAWGELLLDRYLSNHGIGRGYLTTLDRLAYIGNSGMGALEYRPSKNPDYDINGIDYDTIAKECEKILSSKETGELDILYNLGGSSGGTRPKILIRSEEHECIVKFPSKNDAPNSGKMEYDYYICAKKCGIKMTKCELLPSSYCDGYFKTERFDRVGSEKIFSITIAGLLEADFRAPSCDYNAYMKLVKILTREDEEQLEQMFRIMCFNVFTHNKDDHTKNFSFLYNNSKWELAPAYDMTYSTTYFGEHTTSINGKGKNILDNDMISVGVTAGMSKNTCKQIIEEIRDKTAYLVSIYSDTISNSLGNERVGYQKELKDIMQKRPGKNDL
ncbi:MAG: type II toxin-antitoxin system HipA family toxin [Lachnospiraceae bacterium]|nr:type II toxin-antitoxin system HipA family toxin [Lachnospiraceae bacterium]